MRTGPKKSDDQLYVRQYVWAIKLNLFSLSFFWMRKDKTPFSLRQKEGRKGIWYIKMINVRFHLVIFKYALVHRELIKYMPTSYGYIGGMTALWNTIIQKKCVHQELIRWVKLNKIRLIYSWNINKPVFSINERSGQIWSCFRLLQLFPICHPVGSVSSRPVAFVLPKRHRSE